MKKLCWLLLCLCSLTFPACDGEDEQNIIPIPNPRPTPTPTPTPPTAYADSIAPQVEILYPAREGTYLKIGRLSLYVYAYDESQLKEIRAFLEDPSGTRRRLGEVFTGVQEDSKNQYFYSPLLPSNDVVGGWHSLVIEAEDMNKNVTVKSVRINVIADELSKLDFNTAFTSTGWFEWNNGDEVFMNLFNFNQAFYNILNQNQWDYGIDTTHVNDFGLDFGGHSQLWSKWDTNKNYYLEYSEFEKGLEDLKFFKDWDKNKDNLLSEEELADGIGKLWDVNKDNVVTPAEFERKLLKYFLS